MDTVTTLKGIAITAIVITAAAASSVPSVAAQPSGRSCDGRPVAVADTTFGGTDSLARRLIPSGYRNPRYPGDMRENGISGQVVVSFVVDTAGRVPSGGAWIQAETHRSFGDAVCSHLSSTRFVALTVDGRPRSVRVLNAPFSFDVR